MFGTEDARTALYNEFYPKVFGYIRHRLNNDADAEDITSDVFVKVYEKLDTFDETKAALSTWIFHIMQNTLTDYFRTRRVMSQVPETLESDEEIDDSLCRDEMLEELADALEALDERERFVIVLHYYDGQTLRSIAPQLGISYTYTKTVHARALKKIKHFLKI